MGLLLGEPARPSRPLGASERSVAARAFRDPEYCPVGPFLTPRTHDYAIPRQSIIPTRQHFHTHCMAHALLLRAISVPSLLSPPYPPNVNPIEHT